MRDNDRHIAGISRVNCQCCRFLCDFRQGSPFMPPSLYLSSCAVGNRVCVRLCPECGAVAQRLAQCTCLMKTAPSRDGAASWLGTQPSRSECLGPSPGSSINCVALHKLCDSLAPYFSLLYKVGLVMIMPAFTVTVRFTC